jgi:hypothetical protein
MVFVPDTTLRATPRQLRILMIAALVSTGLTVLFGCLGPGRPTAVAFAVVTGVIALVLAPIWLVYLAAFVRLDERGITSRLFVTRSCDWKDVESIRVRAIASRAGTMHTVRLTPRRAAEFVLAVPVNGGIMPDRDFAARVAIVEQAWRLRGGREIAVTR